VHNEVWDIYAPAGLLMFIVIMSFVTIIVIDLQYWHYTVITSCNLLTGRNKEVPCCILFVWIDLHGTKFHHKIWGSTSSVKIWNCNCCS